MPRIPDILLNFTVYLYPSRTAAEIGEKSGGSGFIVSYSDNEASDEKFTHFYVVTNAHVIANSPVIRFNTCDNQVSIIELTTYNWTRHPTGADLAVFPLDSEVIRKNLYNQETKQGLTFFTHTGIITKNDIEELNIGPGDDVYFIGRFINHEGKQRNIPSVRFGAIAQMPKEKIVVQNILPQEAFLIEARSVSGYSGSPVIIHIPPLSNRWDGKGMNQNYYTRLLGINCAFIPFKARLFDKNTGSIIENYYVEGNSGMAVVIPGWEINEILSVKELVFDRKKKEQ